MRSPSLVWADKVPQSAAELRENLAAVDGGPLPDADIAWMRELGRAVHG